MDRAINEKEIPNKVLLLQLGETEAKTKVDGWSEQWYPSIETKQLEDSCIGLSQMREDSCGGGRTQK